MHAYDTEHSIHRIKKLPMPSGGYFAKFNAHQSFPLYGTLIWWFGPNNVLMVCGFDLAVLSYGRKVPFITSDLPVAPMIVLPMIQAT